MHVTLSASESIFTHAEAFFVSRFHLTPNFKHLSLPVCQGVKVMIEFSNFSTSAPHSVLSSTFPAVRSLRSGQLLPPKKVHTSSTERERESTRESTREPALSSSKALCRKGEGPWFDSASVDFTVQKL